MVYECICGRLSQKLMPPRTCSPTCEVEKNQLDIRLHHPCGECYELNTDISAELQSNYADCLKTSIHDKPLTGIPGPGPIEGLPPSYQQATEQPPSYARAVAEEDPATYDNVIAAIATFQPDEIVRVWHTFRASQLSLLPPLMTDLETFERRVSKARRRLHRPEDIGFCEEVIIRLAREQNTLYKSLQLGERYLDATLVLIPASTITKLLPESLTSSVTMSRLACTSKLPASTLINSLS